MAPPVTIKQLVHSCDNLHHLKSNDLKCVDMGYETGIIRDANNWFSLFNTIVKVSFEDSDQTFSAHKELLCHWSEYFRGVFEGAFSEAKKAQVELPSDAIRGFSAFMRWIYTGNVGVDDSNVKYGGDVADLSEYAAVFDFADAHIVPALKNKVADILLERFLRNEKMFEPELVTQLWDGSTASPQIRKPLVDIVVLTKERADVRAEHSFKADRFFPEETRDKYPPGFLFDVCQKLVAIESIRRPKESIHYWRKVDRCLYHDHNGWVAPPKVVKNVKKAYKPIPKKRRFAEVDEDEDEDED